MFLSKVAEFLFSVFASKAKKRFKEIGFALNLVFKIRKCFSKFIQG